LGILLILISGKESLFDFLDKYGNSSWKINPSLNLMATISNFLIEEDEEKWANIHLKL